MKGGIVNKLVFKNSFYNLISVFIGKLGGLIFTILIARLLLPDLFGLYNLVLSIVLIAITFTDMGINGTALRYFSKALGDKNFAKLRGYFSYLFKLKISLSLFIIAILLIFTKYLAYSVFNKEGIILPLIVAGIYIIVIAAKDLFLTLIYALKEIKKTPIIEASNQVSKIILSVLAIAYLSEEWKIAGIFLGFSLSIFISLLVTILLLGKNRSLLIGKREEIKKRKLITYISLMGITGFSLAFFASVDTLMLGRFVDAKSIGLYRAGLSLILTISALFAFSNVLLPVFTQLKKTNFSIAARNITRYILLLAVPATAGIMVLSKRIITMIFGESYILSHKIVYLMAPLIIIFPMVSFYSSLYQAKGEVKKLAICTIITLIANILLNYFLIKGLLPFGTIYSAIGAGIATVISWTILLLLLAINSKDNFRITLNKKSLIKISIASVVMAGLIHKIKGFVVNESIITNLSIILVGIATYGATLIILKEINKKDLEIFKGDPKKISLN